MSRTILFSEVNEVAGRFPDCIAEIRPALAYAGLADDGRPVLQALAERLAENAGFRGALEDAIDAAWNREPQISQLEMLGALVAAARGLEWADAGLDEAGVDAPARALFHFVLECGRRRRAVVAGETGASTELPPSVAADGTDRRARVRTTKARSQERLRAAAQAHEPVSAVRSSGDAPSSPEATGSDFALQAEPPRRWGMGTAATCGVLLGFGLGAFAHFDHRGAPVAATKTVPEASASSPGKVKSVEELRAEIAALDAIANLPLSDEDRHVSRSPGTAARPEVRPQALLRYPVVPGAGAREQVHASALRSAREAAEPPILSSATSAKASASARSGTPLPLVAAVQPVSLTAAALPEASTLRTAGRASVPHVVAGAAGVMAANLMSSPAPAYPPAAVAAGVQGEVIVEAVVGRDGGVVETRVVSGPVSLRASALDAVQRWHYRPFEADGKPVEVATTAVLEFRLER